MPGTAPADGAGAVPDTGVFDVVFVGAGASTSYVLLNLLAELTAEPTTRPLRIGVVDRRADHFPGIAYGDRAARTSLLITSLKDFLPDDERAQFHAWLAENKQWVFDEFLAARGPFSARWWERHSEQVARDEFDELFLPRYVFGRYLSTRVRAAVAAAEAAGTATTQLVHDEVLAVVPEDGCYRLTGRGGVLRAARVVLATGSAPVAPRLSPDPAAPGALLVDDPFADMCAVRDRIGEVLEGVGPDRAPHVVLIGGNAGTMDMLYQVNDLAVAHDRGTRFTIVSPSGELPEPLTPPDPAVRYTAQHLAELERSPAVDAVAIYRAAVADIAGGRSAGLAVTDTLGPISSSVGRLLPRLSHEETLAFAGRWGVELGRHQRRAGLEYHEVVRELRTAGRLQLVAGSFRDLVAADPGRVRVRYDHRGGAGDELDLPADVVINCAGPVRELRDSTSVAATLFEDGVCRPTLFGGGIAVDPAFTAAPGLYVMGPLLAGNVVRGGPVWHMEHCGRISAFGARLGTALAEELRSAD